MQISHLDGIDRTKYIVPKKDDINHRIKFEFATEINNFIT